MRLIWFSCMFWCLFCLFSCIFCCFVLVNKLPVCLCSYLWSNASALCSVDEKWWEMLFFLWLQNGVLISINHVKLRLFSIWFHRSEDRKIFFFFSLSKIADNWKYCKKNWLSLTKLLYFPALVLTFPMWLFQTIRVVSEGNLVYRQKGRTHLLWGLITRRN